MTNVIWIFSCWQLKNNAVRNSNPYIQVEYKCAYIGPSTTATFNTIVWVTWFPNLLFSFAHNRFIVEKSYCLSLINLVFEFFWHLSYGIFRPCCTCQSVKDEDDVFHSPEPQLSQDSVNHARGSVTSGKLWKWLGSDQSYGSLIVSPWLLIYLYNNLSSSFLPNKSNFPQSQSVPLCVAWSHLLLEKKRGQKEFVVSPPNWLKFMVCLFADKFYLLPVYIKTEHSDTTTEIPCIHKDFT